MNALEIRDLTKSYDHFCLDGLTLTVPQGCIVGLIGENGAGKSTTLRLILNAAHPDRGTVTIFGQSNRENPAATKQLLGVVPDRVSFPGGMTTAQIEKMMADTYDH